MTDKGDGLTVAERKLLIGKSADVQQEYTEGMSRAEKRRLERVRDSEKQEKAKYGGKLTTRGDVIQILGLYLERNILPLGFRIDELEAAVEFISQPFWRRWYLTIQLWWRERNQEKEG